jgi:chlorophyllide a reductase subunit Z
VNLDKVEATPARAHRELAWDADAKALLDKLVESQPVLIRISAAKQLRDEVEREARASGAERVTAARVGRARGALTGERAA